MARIIGPYIPFHVDTIANGLPSAPLFFFPDHGADEIEMFSSAIGGLLTLTANATAGQTAELWAWSADRGKWGSLELAFRIAERAVGDGFEMRDLIQRVTPGISAVAMLYYAITDAGSATYQARTVRKVTA